MLLIFVRGGSKRHCNFFVIVHLRHALCHLVLRSASSFISWSMAFSSVPFDLKRLAYLADPEKTLAFYCVDLFCYQATRFGAVLPKCRLLYTPRVAWSGLVLRSRYTCFNPSSISSIVATLKWLYFLKQFDCTMT